MTKDWKLFYRGVMTHITYATRYRQKIGLGAAEDASREVGEGTQSPLSSPYPKNFNQAAPGSVVLYAFMSHSGADWEEAQENNMHYTHRP